MLMRRKNLGGTPDGYPSDWNRSTFREDRPDMDDPVDADLGVLPEDGAMENGCTGGHENPGFDFAADDMGVRTDQDVVGNPQVEFRSAPQYRVLENDGVFPYYDFSAFGDYR